MYVAPARPCTQSVHGRERPCTRTVNKAVYRVPDRVGYPVHGRGRTMYTALARRCTRSVHAVNGRVHGTYNAVHTGRKDGRVHGTRPCTGRVHDRDRVTDGPCTWPCTAVYSLYVYTGTRAVNTAVYRVHDRVGVHGRCTPVYTIRTRRKRPCTRPYTRYIHRRAHGP